MYTLRLGIPGLGRRALTPSSARRSRFRWEALLANGIILCFSKGELQIVACTTRLSRSLGMQGQQGIT